MNMVVIHSMPEKLADRASDIPSLLNRYARTELENLLESGLFSGESVPHGQGEPVVVLPGLHESDRELAYLMRFLKNIGYVPESSGIGLNLGYPWQTHKASRAIQSLKERFGRVYVVGHSLGGFMGAQIAQSNESIKKVVALGAPYLNGLEPTTDTMIESIYSPTDGIVPNVTSLLHGSHTKNFPVYNPNHFALLCHTETFREIAVALAS